MRASLYFLIAVAVVQAQSRPASARASLERAAAALCHGDPDFDPGEILSQAHARAIAPLMNAVAAQDDDEECDHDPFGLLVDLLCEAQRAVPGSRVTLAFAPVRDALMSSDPHRVSAALDVLGSIDGDAYRDPGIESVEPPLGPYPRCEEKKPIIAAAVTPLVRLLESGPGTRRAGALQLLTNLDLSEIGARFVPALVQVLDDRESRDLAAALLTKIGKPSAAAAPRLGRLLAATTDPAAEARYALALATIGAPSRAAAAALPARLDASLPQICGPETPRFPGLFRAARAVGPPPGVPLDRWANGLVARAKAALTRIAPPCAHPEIAEELILEIGKLPPGDAQRDVLEGQMMKQTLAGKRRFLAAWALRSLGAHLAPPSAAVQEEFFGPRNEPPPRLPDKAEDALAPMPKSAIVAGMNAVKPMVVACYARYQVPGMAMVNVEIAPWGRIEHATVTGKFAGTATGACVEQAVKTARFPVSTGLKTPYPFQLK